MGETEFKIFIVIFNLILLVFIGGIVIFFLKYQQRKLISEKEKALLNEQHAMELLSSKLEIQQQTMQDIGREIHDNIGQLLTVASISAYQVAYDNVCPAVNDRITDVGKVIDRSLAELRALSRSLTDEKTEMADLMELVKMECGRINELKVCKVEYDYDESDFTISNITKNFILRVMQEFIQNSLKHAECRNIVLRFNYQPSGLAIHFHDDGNGFDLAAYLLAPDHGIGLENMRKRAEMIGAESAFDSKPGIGTSLDIHIPSSKLNFA